jgi:hypothetical protein
MQACAAGLAGDKGCIWSIHDVSSVVRDVDFMASISG